MSVKEAVVMASAVFMTASIVIMFVRDAVPVNASVSMGMSVIVVMSDTAVLFAGSHAEALARLSSAGVTVVLVFSRAAVGMMMMGGYFVLCDSGVDGTSAAVNTEFVFAASAAAAR